MLQNFIECPATNEKQRNEWLTVSSSFKNNQQENLDHVAYILLRNIEKHMKKEDIKIATFVYVDNNFTLCIWVLLQLPVPQYNPKKPKRYTLYLIPNTKKRYSLNYYDAAVFFKLNFLNNNCVRRQARESSNDEKNIFKTAYAANKRNYCSALLILINETFKLFS